LPSFNRFVSARRFRFKRGKCIKNKLLASENEGWGKVIVKEQAISAIHHFKRLSALLRLHPFEMETEGGRANERHRRAFLTALASGLSRVISISTGLISVPMTLRYLGTERYGLWMTISAIIAFLAFSDLGINNSLLNGIAKAYGRNDRVLARQYVSSAFFLLTAVALVLGAIFLVAYPWISWASIFRVHSTQAMSESGPAIAVFTGCFLLNIPVGIVTRVQSGYQDGFIANLWIALGSVLSLLLLLLVIHYHGSLALLVLAMAGSPILVLVLNGFVLFGIQRPWLIPSKRYVERGVSKDLMHLGGLFFILQLAGAIAFSSDNLVLARIIGPEAVTSYSVPCRLFSLISMVTMLIIAPLWPAYGEALERQDHRWIRKTLYQTLMISASVSVIMSTALVIWGPRIIHLWVGPGVTPSMLLLVGLGIWGVLLSVSSTLAVFLNGISVVRIQVIIASLGACTNIVLSVYLTHRVGIPGVVYGSILSQGFIVLLPYYCYMNRYINKRLPGIANKTSDGS